MDKKTPIKKFRVTDPKGNVFDLNVYKKYDHSEGGTKYTFALYDESEEIGTFDFMLPDGSEYAETYDSYLNAQHRGRGIYQAVLVHARDFFKDQGCRGVLSKGRTRNYDATRAWSHIDGARKKEEDAPYAGKKPVDFYLERLMTFESYAVLEDIRLKWIKQNREIAEKENIRTDGDFIMLYHGTSSANMKKILKSGKLKMGTWFAKTLQEAERYALTKASKGKAAASIYLLYMGSLTYNGYYFTSQEDLYWGDGRYSPKGYRKS